MTKDEMLQEIKNIFGSARAEAYKIGFTDGVEFASKPTDSLINAYKKASDHALSQVWDNFGRGREYSVAKMCIDAILADIINAAKLGDNPETHLEDFWEDEEI